MLNRVTNISPPASEHPRTTAPSAHRPMFRTRPHFIARAPTMAGKAALALVLIAAALTAMLNDVPYGLELLLPAVAMTLTAMITGMRFTWIAQFIMWAGLVVVWATQHISAAEAISVGVVTAVIAFAVQRENSPLLGIFGLHQSTEHEVLRTLLSAVPVILLDHNGRISRASAACKDIFGISQSATVGQDFSDLVPGFKYAEQAGPAVPPGPIGSGRANWHAMRPDQASPVPVELWLDHTPQGPLIRLVDLTPRHAADAQARELHSQLNKVWRLNSLGEMAATLAHELNQPLGAAAAYLHAAQEDMKNVGPLGESALRTTDLAKAQMLRGGQIIRRMRELLTMEMRALEYERVSRIVDDVLPILTLTGQDRSIVISTEIEMPDLVRMDRIQVQQALVNLVRNAVEASPNRSKVVITGKVISDTAYEIAVEDSGPGIAPDQVDSVFQPMTSTKSGGMGLGLSVTRTIVESHGGTLRVGVSRWGGARFSFNLTTARQETEG